MAIQTPTKNGNGKHKKAPIVIRDEEFTEETVEQEEEKILPPRRAKGEVIFDAKPTKKSAATPVSTKIEIPAVNLVEVTVPVVGTNPLVIHNFSAKSIREIEDKQQQKAKLKKEAKVPEQEFLGACYVLPGNVHGFKTVAFKLACVSACRYVEGVSMAFARGAFLIMGDVQPVLNPHTLKPIKIDFATQCRTDMVRIGTMNKVADVRYRPGLEEWMMPLRIRFNANAINMSQIMNLLRMAGMSIGVGEWRPEKNGQFGTFDIPDNFEAIVKKLSK